MSEKNLIIRLSSNQDKYYLYNLMKDGLLGVIDYGSINIRTISLIIFEYCNKYGISIFLLSNIIFLALIHIALQSFKLNISYFMTLIVFY